MEARKVLEMGGGTLLISIPKEWAKKNGIVKGSTVAVEELSERRLIIRPIEALEREQKEVVIDYPKEDITYVLNDITGSYLLGYDIIKIRGKKVIERGHRERLKETISRLIGLEIMEEDSRGITVQFLLEPAAINPEKIVRRMAGIIEGMLKDIIEGVENNDKHLLSAVAERDDEIDKLYFLLVRTIRAATIDPEVAERYRLAPVEVLDYRVLASFIESIGDTIIELTNRLERYMPEREIANQIIDCLNKLVDMHTLSIRSFLSRAISREEGVYLKINSISNDVSIAISKIAEIKGANSLAMIEMLGMIERMKKLFVDISDLTLPNYSLYGKH